MEMWSTDKFQISTWKKRVLDAEHGGPVAVVHGFHDVLFSHVGAAVLYPDACFQVVKMAAVQLEELNEQNAEVRVGRASIDSGVELRHKKAD